MSRARWLAVALFAATVLLYLPSVRNGFVYDDYEVILLQEAPRSPAELLRIFAEPHGLPLSKLPYYRAVTRASLLGQKALHGDAPAPFHAVNALLGGLAASLAFLLLRQPFFGLGDGPAFAGAALFAAHPVLSACVYPIASGRETLLPGILCLGAILGLLQRERRARTAGLACFALALLGKEQAIVLPAAVLLADLLGVGAAPPGRSLRRWAFRLASLLAVVAAYLALRAAIFGVALHRGTEPPPSLQLGGPMLSALFALQSVFAPFVELRYEPLLASWWSPLRVIAACAAFAAVAAAGFWRADGAWRRRTAFWIGFSAIFLLPTANLLRQEAPYDERFALLSCLGAAALVAGLLARSGARPRWRLPLRLGTALAVAALAGVSLGRGDTYRDALTFQRQWAETSPAHANARFSYGTALLREGNRSAARQELEAAIAISPAHGAAHFNLAVLLAGEGAPEEAAEHFRTVLRLDPGDEDARANLAVLLEAMARRRAPGATP